MDLSTQNTDSPSLHEMASDRASFCDICRAVLEAWGYVSMDLEHSQVDTLFEVDEILKLREGCHLCSILAGHEKYIADFRGIQSRQRDITLQGGVSAGATAYKCFKTPMRKGCI